MKKIENLPKKISVFPLSNFIIFPNTSVPLNIFEPRYIKMIDDCMKTDRIIGMIQPKNNRKRNPRAIQRVIVVSGKVLLHECAQHPKDRLLGLRREESGLLPALPLHGVALVQVSVQQQEGGHVRHALRVAGLGVARHQSVQHAAQGQST